MTPTQRLERAWERRQAQGLLSEPIEKRALRLWHGPGDSESALRDWSVDGYGTSLWITGEGDLQTIAESTQAFYSRQGYRGAVVLTRPKGAVPELPTLLWGEVPSERFEVREGELKFWIRLVGNRHPGLFLDHRPLREWLVGSGSCKGRKVLNTFAYTGSLSVAAFAGGATQVTTVDLSKATLQWARENAELNGQPPEQARFFAGDFFEEIPRLRRKGEQFGVVISDPPSFSRGKKGNFSTQKDLVRLHSELFSVMSPGGILISSINSANVSVREFDRQVHEAALAQGLRYEVLSRIEQPASFPAQSPASRYLKGLILQLKD